VAALAAPSPSQGHIGVTMQPQEGDNWCWAAVAVSVRNFLDPADPLRQCDLANTQLNRTDCCQDPKPGDCDVPSALDLALTNAQVPSTNQSGTLLFSEVATEIGGNRPVMCAIRWASGFVYHFIQIDGFVQSGRGNELIVNDPQMPQSRIPFNTLFSTYRGTGSWVWTYKTL
jgi:hypothetical protein